MKILIVDDHELIRTGLSDALMKSGFEVIGEASSMSQALAMLNQYKPEITLVDINLGSSSGINLIEQAIASKSDSKFIVVTMHDDSATLNLAKMAGATAFVTKSAPIESLIEVIEQITAGVKRFLKAGEIKPIIPKKAFQLTARELEVLAILPTGATASAIGSILFLSEATIKTHLANIYRKLGAANRAQAVSIGIENLLITN
ncbi:MAG: response regulator transcription factor [Candidatus Nanopelagicus sp.]